MNLTITSGGYTTAPDGPYAATLIRYHLLAPSGWRSTAFGPAEALRRAA